MERKASRKNAAKAPPPTKKAAPAPVKEKAAPALVKEKATPPRQQTTIATVTKESPIAVMDGHDGLLLTYAEGGLSAGTPVAAEHEGKSLNTEQYATALHRGDKIKLVTRM